MKSLRVCLVALLLTSPFVHSIAALQEESGVEYAVQLLTVSKRVAVTDKKFKGVEGIQEEKINGVYKYTTARVKGHSEASELAEKMKGLGFKGPFVIRYKDGKRDGANEAVKAESQNMNKAEMKATPAKQMSKSNGKPVVGSPITQTDAGYPGGPDSLNAFINRNLRYPEQPISKASEGRVLISFRVDTEGKRKNVNVAIGVNKELDAEALRVVNMMPDWIPGTAGGSPAEKEILLPVNYYQPR